MDWINGIAAQNKFSDGRGLLFDDAYVVHHGDKTTEGAFGTIQQTIGGYIIVKAENIEEAIAFAKGSPVLQAEGNSVEVRRIAR